MVHDAGPVPFGKSISIIEPELDEAETAVEALAKLTLVEVGAVEEVVEAEADTIAVSAVRVVLVVALPDLQLLFFLLTKT